MYSYLLLVCAISKRGWIKVTQMYYFAILEFICSVYSCWIDTKMLLASSWMEAITLSFQFYRLPAFSDSRTLPSLSRIKVSPLNSPSIWVSLHSFSIFQDTDAMKSHQIIQYRLLILDQGINKVNSIANLQKS